MATYTLPFEKGDIVEVGTNSFSIPVGTQGTVTDLQNIGTSGAWLARVSIPDDERGTVEFMLPVTALTLTGSGTHRPAAGT